MHHHATIGGGRRLCFQALDQRIMFVAAIVCRHDDDDGIVVDEKSTLARDSRRSSLFTRAI
jgi:hypothetical protein